MSIYKPTSGTSEHPYQAVVEMMRLAAASQQGEEAEQINDVEGNKVLLPNISTHNVSIDDFNQVKSLQPGGLTIKSGVTKLMITTNVDQLLSEATGDIVGGGELPEGYEGWAPGLDSSAFWVIPEVGETAEVTVTINAGNGKQMQIITTVEGVIDANNLHIGMITEGNIVLYNSDGSIAYEEDARYWDKDDDKYLPRPFAVQLDMIKEEPGSSSDPSDDTLDPKLKDYGNHKVTVTIASGSETEVLVGATNVTGDGWNDNGINVNETPAMRMLGLTRNLFLPAILMGSNNNCVNDQFAETVENNLNLSGMTPQNVLDHREALENAGLFKTGVDWGGTGAQPVTFERGFTSGDHTDTVVIDVIQDPQITISELDDPDNKSVTISVAVIDQDGNLQDENWQVVYTGPYNPSGYIIPGANHSGKHVLIKVSVEQNNPSEDDCSYQITFEEPEADSNGQTERRVTKGIKID